MFCFFFFSWLKYSPLEGLQEEEKFGKNLNLFQASSSANSGGPPWIKTDDQNGLTVSHRHPQTCLSLPLNPGFHLSVECEGMLFNSYGEQTRIGINSPPLYLHLRGCVQSGEQIWENSWGESHGLNKDSVYSIAEICGGTVKISLFVQAVHAYCAH